MLTAFQDAHMDKRHKNSVPPATQCWAEA